MTAFLFTPTVGKDSLWVRGRQVKGCCRCSGLQKHHKGIKRGNTKALGDYFNILFLFLCISVHSCVQIKLYFVRHLWGRGLHRFKTEVSVAVRTWWFVLGVIGVFSLPFSTTFSFPFFPATVSADFRACSLFLFGGGRVYSTEPEFRDHQEAGVSKSSGSGSLHVPVRKGQVSFRCFGETHLFKFKI